MASGYSYSGGPPKCFAYWQEFSKCYAQADHPKQCVLQSEDYLECLHGIKKAARMQQIQEQLARKLRAEGHESRKSAEVSAQGAAVGVGLIQEGK